MARKKAAAASLGWWGERWLKYTAGDLHIGPSSDGQLSSAARAETQITVSRGQVTAVVAVGSLGYTAKAILKVKPLTTAGWRRVLDAIAADPDTAHRLLSGNPGPDLEAAFAGVDQALFPVPTGSGRPVRCTCTERWGCRHVNALVVHGTALFDANPLLWLEVLGQGREPIFAALRARMADSGMAVHTGAEIALTAETTRTEEPLSAEHFWQTELDPDRIAVRAGSAAVPDALLRLLGPIALPAGSGSVELWGVHGPEQRSLDQVLRQYVTHIGEGASALARGDRAPDYVPRAMEGKAVPIGVRLASEVEEAVRQAGGVLGLPELRTLCPTAAALPENQYRPPLMGALAELPPDLVVLGQHFVAPQSAVLDGATFCHVITFDEWRQGSLTADADWATALAIAGHQPPYQVRVGKAAYTTETLWGAVMPEVGDELRLTVHDPNQPALAATLVRRRQRGIEKRNRASQAAGRTLLKHLTETGRSWLCAPDALGILLGERLYQGDGSTDPVWLLPLRTQGLSHRGFDREITTQNSAWYPTFGNAAFGYWNGQNAVQRFQAELMHRGAKRERVEQATTCVNWWCRYCRGKQDVAAQPVPLGVLLQFLWMVVPLEALRYGIAREPVPEDLALWFTVVSAGSKALRQAYGDHIAACGLTELYADRLGTKPRRLDGAERLAWDLEGYRWIGPGHFFAWAEPEWRR